MKTGDWIMEKMDLNWLAAKKYPNKQIKNLSWKIAACFLRVWLLHFEWHNSDLIHNSFKHISESPFNCDVLIKQFYLDCKNLSFCDGMNATNSNNTTILNTCQADKVSLKANYVNYK